MVYIDGFAGPGRYSGGEDGSPVIALRAALRLQNAPTAPKVTAIFLFVEKDRNRADMLQAIVDAIERPRNVRVKIAGGQTFEEAFREFISFYDARKQRLPPTFAFIDPFGWTGAPFSIVKRIMSYPACEVLVNFMYEEINRFVSPPSEKMEGALFGADSSKRLSRAQSRAVVEANFDSFFGCSDWRAAMKIDVPRERNRFLHDLYAKQLHEAAGVKYVRSFQMKNDRDVTDYYLFHGTNSIKGLQKMKEAMWAVDESGEFTFSDSTDPDQFVMFEKRPRFDVLRRQMLSEFSGKSATVANIEEWVLARTPFRETHYKSILKALEQATPPQLAVIDPPPGRRRGTFSLPTLKVRFR